MKDEAEQLIEALALGADTAPFWLRALFVPSLRSLRHLVAESARADVFSLTAAVARARVLVDVLRAYQDAIAGAALAKR